MHTCNSITEDWGKRTANLGIAWVTWWDPVEEKERKACWLVFVILTLEKLRQGLVQPWLHSEFQTSLGNSIHCLKKKWGETSQSRSLSMGNSDTKCLKGCMWRGWGCTSWRIHLINTPFLTGSWLLIVSMETVEHCFQLTLFLKNTIFSL